MTNERCYIENGRLVTPLSSVNIWSLYWDINELLRDGDSAKDYRQLRAVTRAELEGIIENLGVEKNPLAKEVTIAELVNHDFLTEADGGYKVTAQGVALWSAINRRI